MKSNPSSATWEHTDLSELVSHSEMVLSNYSLEQVHRKFGTHNHEFMAVLDGEQVLGICSRQNIGMLLGARYGFALFSRKPVREYLSPAPVLVHVNQVISDVLKIVSSRKDESFYDDAVLLGHDGEYLGLIHVHVLVRLQTQFLRDNIGKLGKALGELKETHKQLKAAQRQLIEAEKMQTAARLAAGVAHEVRNPLNILSTGIEFLCSDPDIHKDPTRQIVFVEMREAIRRADSVICTLMNSAEGSNLDLKKFDINALIESALSLRGKQITQYGIKVVKELGKELPAMEMDAKKMELVFDGLLSNAIEAMGEKGGVLAVRTSEKQLAPDDVEYNPGARSGQRHQVGDRVVMIEIADSGCGIPSESLHEIFDPFFTTRKTGSGLGLGLTVCRKILELHNSSLEITNRDEGGVKATMVFNAS